MLVLEQEPVLEPGLVQVLAQVSGEEWEQPQEAELREQERPLEVGQPRSPRTLP